MTNFNNPFQTTAGGYVYQGSSAVPSTLSIASKTVIPALPSLGQAFKPKKAGTKTAHIVFVLDESGSMSSCRDSTIAGFNEFLASQAKDVKETGIKTYVTLYKFDGYNVTSVFAHANIADVKPLSRETYSPSGGTNLLDAIGGAMMQINTDLSAKKKVERDSITLVIMTDGEENSSHSFNNSDIKVMIEKSEAKNWGFMFLGANVDAFSVGNAMGFGVQNTMQYDTLNMNATMSAASNMTNRMKSARAAGMDTTLAYAASTFTAAERDEANDK